MTATKTSTRQPRFCRHCGAALPPTQPRFCIECGGALGASRPPAQHTPSEQSTVLLPNARVEQSVIGGTIRLPSSGAVPPGLWLREQPPGPADVVAIYAPLRAIVGGWSGLGGAGWRRNDESLAAFDSTNRVFQFETQREWFPAPGYGQGLRLRVRLRAQAEAEEGHQRRGFRYRAHHDPPMEVVEASWRDPATGALCDHPLPQIQIMAPPRARRVSDYDERIATMAAADAAAWAREGAVHGLFLLLQTSQQRTPAGRGLPLAEAGPASWLGRIIGQPRERYHVQVFHPLVCRWPEWRKLRRRIRDEARGLGLDLDTDLTVEWWLDRQGHDCVIFEEAERLYGHQRVVIAFRRAQIAQAEDI